MTAFDTVHREMTTKRTTSKEGRGRSVVTTNAADLSLEPVEEKVVRMMRGFRASDEMPLGRVGQDHPETAAKLREMELRALERSGRLAELRGEAEVPASTKQKIIARLNQQDPEQNN